jgi:integrase/recombinase XerD
MKQAATLTKRQLKIVLAHCATRQHAARDRAIVMVSFLAGLRAKEIAALMLSDVIDAEGHIRSSFILSPEQTKGRKARRVFVSERLQRELGAYIKQRKLRPKCAALFPTQKDQAFSANSLCQLFLKIYAESGITGASSHSGRRSLLTSLAAKGVSVRVLQEIAGHSSMAITQRYIDVNDQQMRAAIELM